MAEHERVVSGSPFTASGNAIARPANLTTARLVASGGPCTVKLYDTFNGADTEIIELQAGVGTPDTYSGAANRRLAFQGIVKVTFVAGNGNLYLYET